MDSTTVIVFCMYTNTIDKVVYIRYLPVYNLLLSIDTINLPISLHLRELRRQTRCLFSRLCLFTMFRLLERVLTLEG